MKRIFLWIALFTAFSTRAQQPKKPLKKLDNSPVFFIDSVNVFRDELNNYDPLQIAMVTVYKDTMAVNLIGAEGKNGVVYIETKAFARNRYWNYFQSKSDSYLKAVPRPESDTSVQYILNNKVLKNNIEAT